MRHRVWVEAGNDFEVIPLFNERLHCGEHDGSAAIVITGVIPLFNERLHCGGTLRIRGYMAS